MWEYKIYKTDLGWGIYRKKEIGKMLLIEYLNGHGAWTLNKNYARTFYNKDDVISALVITKRKRGQTESTSTPTTNSGDTKEKQSWSEL